MWNPLHFAVYFGHLDILKFFIEEYSINCPLLTLMKTPADSEDEPVNIYQFIDDKLFSLIHAFEQNHLDVFEYLLSRFS